MQYINMWYCSTALACLFKISVYKSQTMIWLKLVLILWNARSRALPVCSWSLLMSSSAPLLPLTAALLLFCHQMALLVKRMVRLDCVVFQIITGVHLPLCLSYVPLVSPSKSSQWLLWICMDSLCMRRNPNVHISFSRTWCLSHCRKVDLGINIGAKMGFMSDLHHKKRNIVNLQGPYPS